MKGLPTLIRLARRRGDEQRVALVEAERQSLLASEAMARHDHAANQETAHARGKPEEMAMWSDWSRHAARHRSMLAMVTRQLLQQEDHLREGLRENFAETKRLEIALDTLVKAAARQAARKAEIRAEDMELRRVR